MDRRQANIVTQEIQTSSREHRTQAELASLSLSGSHRVTFSGREAEEGRNSESNGSTGYARGRGGGEDREKERVSPTYETNRAKSTPPYALVQLSIRPPREYGSGKCALARVFERVDARMRKPRVYAGRGASRWTHTREVNQAEQTDRASQHPRRVFSRCA